MDLDRRLQHAVQHYWSGRLSNREKQEREGKRDAGARGEVTAGSQMSAVESLVAGILVESGVPKGDIRTRTELELPGYFRATKKWDLVVVSSGRLVAAMEFKSQAGASIGNNVNNRTEEAVGSANDIWTAYREGRFGASPPPFLGYFFLLEDQPKVRTPVRNKEPHFAVDSAFRGTARISKEGHESYSGVSYAERYELLCRRLIRERLYSSACFILATKAGRTVITQPAADLTFQRFAHTLRGHIFGQLDESKSEVAPSFNPSHSTLK